MNWQRWQELMLALGLPASEGCYQDLVAAYSEPHRHYHTEAHINAMLGHLDETRDLAEQPNELELAIWFHDAVYRPFSSKNELKSAEWARTFLQENAYKQDGIRRVFDLIMATLHNGDVKTNDERLMVDIDLSILAAPQHVFDTFERTVRAEYRWVPGLLYRRKRKALLAAFLARPSIYYTERFQASFEEAARANLARAVSVL